MNQRLLHFYHRLPYALKCCAAACQGLRLQRWRYGANTESLVAEALAVEHRDPREWDAWQQRQLTAVLRRAVNRSPYYRRMWAQLGKVPTNDCRCTTSDDWERLENWPLLEKESLRTEPESFVSDDCNRSQMFHEHTSGTSGKPVSLWQSRDTLRRWYAIFEARWRRWNGVTRHDRWGVLGGQIVTSPNRCKPPFWVWNAASRQLYLSSYHLSPRYIPAYLDAIARHRLRYLWGYTSALYALAQETLRLGRDDIRLAVVLTNAEPLDANQKQTITAAFQCPVRETYGMSEMVAAAAECEAGNLHLWPEAGIVEVLDENGVPLPRGETGEFVCTGLFNTDMPLVRYRLGDRGALDDSTAPCPCGRTLPRLKHIEGRSDDVLFTKDGRRIGRLDPVFKARLPVREAQIVQESLDLIIVRYVPTEEFNAAAGESIASRLRDRMGDMRIQLEPVEKIERTSNGKFRAVICKISEPPVHAPS